MIPKVKFIYFRNQPESLCVMEEKKMLLEDERGGSELGDVTEIYEDLEALERDNWITPTAESTCWTRREPDTSWRMTPTDPLPDMDTAAPPIPPRSSSWNLSTPTCPDTELHIPESPMATVRKCHSPCILVDRKCSSPSIVRKFEAMLQENEGKVLVDGTLTSCAVPVNSNCNVGCCHSRWSCDVSKFSTSKLSPYGTVQKSFSEVNIRSAYSDFNPAAGNLQIPPMVKELPVDLLLSSLEISPVISSLQGSRRNIMLEQKTAEFNRTLFQAEMGRGVEEKDSLTDGSLPDEAYTPRESTSQLHCADVTMGNRDQNPEVTSSLSTSDAQTLQNLEVKPRQRKCAPDVQEAKAKPEIPFNLPPEQPQVGLREATTTSSQCELKQRLGSADSPCRKTQHRAATESLFCASTPPGPNVEDSTSKKEDPLGAKPQSARADVSPQQPAAEDKHRPTAAPGQAKPVSAPLIPSDSTRPGHRIMTEHPWKPLTLAAYPRPEGSRSNYGAVERILKNYESAARAQQNHGQQDETASCPDISPQQGGKVIEVNMLDMHPLLLPPPLRTSPSFHTQLSSHQSRGVKDTQLTVQVGAV